MQLAESPISGNSKKLIVFNQNRVSRGSHSSVEVWTPKHEQSLPIVIVQYSPSATQSIHILLSEENATLIGVWVPALNHTALPHLQLVLFAIGASGYLEMQIRHSSCFVKILSSQKSDSFPTRTYFA